MSLKVLSTTVPDGFSFGPADEKGIRCLMARAKFSAHCNIDGELGWLDFECDVGLLYNGASNPFGWPIKNYYGEPKKDCCGLGHDILYACGGEVIGLDRDLKAGECDDYIRGAMREAGFNRKEAGIVDWCVRHFAHCLHFGKKNDKEKMRLFSKVLWFPECSM